MKRSKDHAFRLTQLVIGFNWFVVKANSITHGLAMRNPVVLFSSPTSLSVLLVERR